MVQMIEANWLAFVLALLIGLVVAWWLFGRGSKQAKPRERRPDALDEGAEPAKRNQALMDAPSAVKAASLADTGPDIFGGIGEVFGAAAAAEVADASSPASPPPAPAAEGEGDDLRRIKGVGPKLVKLLQSLGVTRFEQIANWTEEDIDRVDAQLGNFKGRIRRDSWVEQAKFLASDDTAGFEAKFGKL